MGRPLLFRKVLTGKTDHHTHLRSLAFIPFKKSYTIRGSKIKTGSRIVTNCNRINGYSSLKWGWSRIVTIPTLGMNSH